MDVPKDAKVPSTQDELRQLRTENEHLRSLLAKHGIKWQEADISERNSNPTNSDLLPPHRTAADKVALFRRLFRGREDVYALRWESAKGKAGYSPACDNEWKTGVCHKPRVKCGDCSNRLLRPVTDQVIYDHLAGKHTTGAYPLLADDTCYFLAADFDDADWQEDSQAFIQSCGELGIPASLEVSRSGNGAHAWIFFSGPVPAREARQLGAALISYTCDRTRQLSLKSYDRLFPNQDILPKGGFGNLIALPLQKDPREFGRSVFVDEQFNPYPDQWEFLAKIQSMSRKELEDATLRASGGRHHLDVAFSTEEEENKPWQRPLPVPPHIDG